MEGKTPGAIPIDSDIINKLKDDQFQHNGEEAGGDKVSFQALQKAAGYIVNTADDALGSYIESLGGSEKEVEKVKWVDETRKHVSELGVLIGKRKLSDDFLKNSPELLLGSIIAGKLVIAGMVVASIKKRNPNPTIESNSEQENEKKTAGSVDDKT